MRKAPALHVSWWDHFFWGGTQKPCAQLVPIAFACTWWIGSTITPSLPPTSGTHTLLCKEVTACPDFSLVRINLVLSHLAQIMSWSWMTNAQTDGRTAGQTTNPVHKKTLHFLRRFALQIWNPIRVRQNIDSTYYFMDKFDSIYTTSAFRGYIPNWWSETDQSGLVWV